MSRNLVSIVLGNLRRSKNHFFLASIGIVVGIAAFTFFLGLGLGVRQVVLGKIFPLNQLEVVPKSLHVDLGPLRMAMGGEVIGDAKVAELSAIPGVERVYPKMRLTVPAVATGGESLLGADLRTELVADGIEPDLVQHEVGSGYVFSDFDATDSPSARTCRHDTDCGEHQYCGVPAGTLVSPEAVEGPAQGPQVCRHYIPVLASEHVVELYNGALRRAHQLPKLNPEFVLGFTFDITFGTSMVHGSNRDHVLHERAMLVGFSNKAITLGVTLPLGYVQRLNAAFGSPDDAHRFHAAILGVPNKDAVARVAKDVERLGLAVADTGAEQAAFLIATFMAIFGLVSAVIVGIAAVNIMHVFFMLVYERQHEIGIMRAVGARRSHIARIILGEAGVLGAIAGVAGTTFAIVSAAGVDRLSARYIPDFPYKPTSYFVFPLGLYGAAIAFSVGFCILGAWLPARRAAHMEPARVLSGH